MSLDRCPLSIQSVNLGKANEGAISHAGHTLDRVADLLDLLFHRFWTLWKRRSSRSVHLKPQDTHTENCLISR